MTIQTSVKRPEDTVSLDAMAFALAHPAVIRRLGSALLESRSDPGWVSDFNGGYGSTAPVRQSHLRDLDEGAVLIDGVSDAGSWDTPQKAIASMGKRLSKATPAELSDLLSTH